MSQFTLKYTICFCTAGEKILMIYRTNEPNKSKWNGLGGKIEGDETPKENVFREIQEEADLDLSDAEIVTFAGIVTWEGTRKNGETIPHSGMYAFVADFPETILFPNRDTREGVLSWIERDWLCDTSHTEVAENVPYFLPQMLSKNSPKNYHCTYDLGALDEFIVKDLPKNISV